MFDKHNNLITQNNFTSFTSLQANIGTALGVKVYFSLKNHSINRFRQHFQYSVPGHNPGIVNTFAVASFTLKGRVLKAEEETFTVSFEEDRLTTNEVDAFVFRKSTPYVGAYMMPAAGDTAYIEFRFLIYNGINPFESANCVRIERSGKK